MSGLWERVFELLKEQDKRQSDLARAVDASTSQVSLWISNDRIPRGDYMLRIADFFGVSVRFLLTGFEDPAVDEDGEYVALAKRKLKIADLSSRLVKASTDQITALEAVFLAMDL